MILLRYPIHILARHRIARIVESEAGICQVDNCSHTAKCEVWFVGIPHLVVMCADCLGRLREEVGNGTFSDSIR